MYVYIFCLLNVFSIVAMVERLSDIKNDTALMWEVLHTLKGTRILAPGKEPQETDVFPKDKGLPPEIVSHILRFANSAALKEHPAKERLVREFSIQNPINDTLANQLWLSDSNKILCYNRLERQLYLRRTQLPSACILDIQENTVTSVEGQDLQTYKFLIPQENHTACRIWESHTVEVIDRATYNHLNNLPSTNSEYNDPWIKREFLASNSFFRLSPDKSKYISQKLQLLDSSFLHETLVVHDVQTGQPLKTFSLGRTIDGSPFAWVTNTTLALERKTLSETYLLPQQSRIDVYDITHQDEEPLYSVDNTKMNDFVSSPQGSFLALQRNINENDHQIEFFDAQTGKALFVLNQQEFPYTPSSMWSPDESMVCVRTAAGMPRVYAIKDKEMLVDYFKNNSETSEQFLLFMLLRFNFNKEDLKHILSKFPANVSGQLESFLDLP